MSTDLWSRVSSGHEEAHLYVVGADLVNAVRSGVDGWVPEGDVVELGCGTGLYTRAYAQRCRKVTATDLSPRMVERAREMLVGMPNVTVSVADATETQLPAQSADGVVAVNLLHIVPDAAAVLTEAYRLLRPGGVLIAADASGDGMSIGQALGSIGHMVRRPSVLRAFPRAKGQQDLGQGSLETLVRSAGFGAVEGRLLRGRTMNCAFVRAVRPE
jgi:ubiquinone/menaquinone biosynthesis C-methylase UbiE